jgi:hypothetical protein
MLAAMRSHRVTVLGLAFALAACAGQQAEPWVAADGTSPPVSEVGDCHAEANRQAATRYPDQLRRDSGSVVRIEDERRFPAHIGFFEQCMKRKGYARASAPARQR